MEVQIIVNQQNIDALMVRHEQLTAMVVQRDEQLVGLSKLVAQQTDRIEALETRARQPIQA